MILSISDVVIATTLYLNGLALLGSSSLSHGSPDGADGALGTGTGNDGNTEAAPKHDAALELELDLDPSTDVDGDEERKGLLRGGGERSGVSSCSGINSGNHEGKGARNHHKIHYHMHSRSSSSSAGALTSMWRRLAAAVRRYSCVVAAWNAVFLLLVLFVFRE